MANELEKTTENTTETKEQKPVSTASLEARIKELEADNQKLKNAVNTASADASEWKKKYNGKLSEEEQAKEAQESATAAMQKELEALRRERNIANYVAALGGSDIGMDSENAKAVAEALNDGNIDHVIGGLRKFIASHDKALAEKAMQNNPTLPGGSTTRTVSKAEFDSMGYREMVQFKAEHPDLYAEYMK